MNVFYVILSSGDILLHRWIINTLNNFVKSHRIVNLKCAVCGLTVLVFYVIASSGVFISSSLGYYYIAYLRHTSMYEV